MGVMEAEEAVANVQRAAADSPQKPLLPIDIDTDRVTNTGVCFKLPSTYINTMAYLYQSNSGSVLIIQCGLHLCTSALT